MVLAAFGVLVIAGAVAAVKQGGPSTPSTVSVAVSTPTTSPSSSSADPTAEATAEPSRSPVAAGSAVLLVGPDLAKLTSSLATLTGYEVLTASSAAPEVLAPGALDGITATPSAVVLEVLAGTKTTIRTTTAIAAVTAKWPDVHVLVVGPFSSADRKSAAAAKSAALAASATFLDPVDLDWRTADVSPVLTAADQTAVTEKLAAALA